MEVDWVRLRLIRMRQQRRRRARRLIVIREEALRVRNLRDQSNPFEMPEHSFVAKYRLSRELARDLIKEVRPFMRAPQRNTGIPIHVKVLGTLHFFGHGSDQKGVGADRSAAMSQPSVSRAIREVVRALNAPALIRTGIPFPLTEAERRVIIHSNSLRSSIPGVLGYIDGAHILIVGPDVHEEQYVNRLGTHSLNVQVTCDSNMMILNILARYPGSTNDSFVWANSALRAKMEELYRGGEQCWLLGDSGYPNEPWLHVPVADAIPNSREANFNSAHMVDRSVVERTIGHLRNRFRWLSKHRVLEYGPVKSGMIVNACAVLHNKCVRGHVAPPPAEEENIGDQGDDDEPPPSVDHGRVRDRLLLEGRAVRDRIIARVPVLQPRAPFNVRRPHRRAQR